MFNEILTKKATLEGPAKEAPSQPESVPEKSVSCMFCKKQFLTKVGTNPTTCMECQLAQAKLEAAQHARREKSAHRGTAMGLIVVGLLLVGVGIAITAATHEAAVSRGGGTYVVAYGPIVAGVIALFRGLVRLGS
jgi:hypothetical protein